MTETGYEAANLGMQIFGGHGYIKEWGMEQNVRDCRISMLYEGTTGIQSLDLLGRKVLMTQGASLMAFAGVVKEFTDAQADNDKMKEFIEPLNKLMEEWGNITMQIGGKAMENPDEINAACVDYLMYSGYVTYAYLFAQAAAVAQKALEAGTTEDQFYEGKLYLARFYFQRILPRTETLTSTMVSGVENLLSASFDPFA